MAKSGKLMYGIGQVRFGEKVIGCTEKGSWGQGGTKPKKTDVEAEQMPTAPMLTLTQKNSTISPTLNLIQLGCENLRLVMGGTLAGTSGAHAGWKAPTSLVELRDKCEIDLVSGRTVRMPSAMLISNLGGKLTLTEVSKLGRQLTVNMSENGDAPYEMFDTQEDLEGQRMKEDATKQIQRERADALLDASMSVPLGVLCIPLRKEPVELRMTMRRPYLFGQIRFARTYLSIGVIGEQMQNLSKEEGMELMAGYGKKISRMIVYAIYRGWQSRHLLLWPTS